MTECRIPARSISMLVGIKQALLADNELCNKVCKLGKLAMANYMDDLIEKVCRLETLYNDYYCTFKIIKSTLDEIDKLMDGYTPDVLSEERLAELQALIHKWQKQDEGDGHAE